MATTQKPLDDVVGALGRFMSCGAASTNEAAAALVEAAKHCDNGVLLGLAVALKSAYQQVRALKKQLEDVRALDYKDVWTKTADYQRNNVVTANGHLWIAKADNVGIEPGTNPDVWKLAVRRGKDAR